jgi:hypothetical protein
LNPNVAWGTDKVGPKPVVPAFAAETFLLDRYYSLGSIETLGGTSWGYAFERAGDIILALWDYGKQPKQVLLPTGVKAVTLYDWMGNSRRLKTVNGNISLLLGPEPVYVRGVSLETVHALQRLH